MKQKIVDLSVKLSLGMFTFPGNKPFYIYGPYNAVGGKYREYCYDLQMTTQTGTHIQASHYFLEKGETIDNIPLDRFEGEIVCLDMQGTLLITKQKITEQIKSEHLYDKVVLLKTGFMDKIVALTKEEDTANLQTLLREKPGLSLDGAKFLSKLRPKILGIDSFGLEPFGSKDYVVNHYLCKQKVIILEGLINLDKIDGSAQLIAYPLPIPMAEGTPCRAIAKVRTNN